MSDFRPIDALGQFREGYELGGTIGRQSRDAEAFRDGGLEQVERRAGETGDLQTMNSTMGMRSRQRQFANDEMRMGYENMQAIGPWARNVVKATRSMDPQRAGAFLNQHRQRFLDFGLLDEQVNAGIAGLTSEDPNERQQWQQQLDQAFSQHENPDWNIDPRSGQIGGIEPNTGQYVEGGQAPAGLGQEWRPATPEEVQQWGASGVWDVNVQSGERRPRQRPYAPRSAGAGGETPSLPSGFEWE